MTGPAGVELPYPGDELVERVAGHRDRELFFRTGRESVAGIEAALGVVGRTLDSYARILDFGCGCGRILLWLEHLSRSAELYGCDIDERAIRWAGKHIPWAGFAVNEGLPPLPYGDGAFDLVYNHSVFTHLDEDYQDRWLAELRRVVEPGGTLVLSVDGEHGFRAYERNIKENGGDPAPVRERFDRDGILFVRDDDWLGGAFPDFYHSTFHAPWYVLEHWGRMFKVCAYLPQGALGWQDLVVLERPSEDSPAVSYPSRAAPVTQDAGARRARRGPVRRLRDAARRAAARAAGDLARRAVVRQGERINTLENEVFARLDALEERLDRLERRDADG